MASLTRSVLMRKFNPGRCFHTSQIRLIDPKTVEEVKIPVPWGHVAGKWWGEKNIQPVIAVHGWQDNAGSWDPMAELMPDNFSLLAIDLPGNGQSSHIPPFQSYHLHDAITILRRIKNHFGWDKVDLIGHSGGSLICFLYAAVFTENVKSFFGIDYLVSCYIDEKKRIDYIGNLIDKRIDMGFRDHSSSRSYSLEEAKQMWKKATSLSDKATEILMKRGVNKLPDGKYIFSRDQRLKIHDIHVFNLDEVNKLALNITCDVRLIRASNSPFFNKGIKYCPDILNIIEKNAKSYKLYELDGEHHLHMETPEKVVSLFVELLNQK